MTTGALDIQANSTQGPPSDIGPTGGDPPAHGGVIGTGLLEPGRAAWPHGWFESRPGHWPQPYQRCPGGATKHGIRIGSGASTLAGLPAGAHTEHADCTLLA